MTSLPKLHPGAALPQSKQISNRLLNMKFMQRAEASTSQKDLRSPSTPTGEPAPKRRRTGDFATTISNLNVDSPANNYPTAIPGTPVSEAHNQLTGRRTNHFATEAGDTEWVLDVRIPTTNGTANSAHEDDGEISEDEEDEDEDDIWSTSAPLGRQSYGTFNRKKTKQQQEKSHTDPAATAVTMTPTSTKKRGIVEDLESGEELSSIPTNSDLESDSSSSEPNGSTRSSAKKKTGSTFDIRSEADLKRMDNFDFQSAGFEHGFGRQRSGLGGGGGGGHGQGHGNKQGRYSNRGHGKQQQQQQYNHSNNRSNSGKKRVRKTM